jgi:FkbM family methyltransferase
MNAPMSTPLMRRALRGIGRRLLIAGLNANRYDMNRNGEAWVVQKLAKDLRTVIDVGANAGAWALEVIKVSNEAEIFCVEAIPEFADNIRSRLGSRVTVVQTALSNESGTLELYKSKGGARAAPLNSVKVLERRSVSCMTGDSLVTAVAAQEVSLIKIDVDGYDFPVIESFPNTLEQFRPIVQFEYSRFWIATRHYLKDAFDFFSNRDYVVGRIMPRHVEFKDYMISDETFMTNNFVAVPREKISIFA